MAIPRAEPPKQQHRDLHSKFKLSDKATGRIPRTTKILLGLCLTMILAAVGISNNVTLRMAQSSRGIQIAFVHPGKTGGTTIGTMLRVACDYRGVTNPESRDYCLREWRDKHAVRNENAMAAPNEPPLLAVQESQLSKHTFGFVHGTQAYPGDQTEVLNEATHIMISLRNPIERVVSWFYYMHPTNCYDGDQHDNETGDSTSTTGHNDSPHTRQPYTLQDKACITKRRLEPSTRKSSKKSHSNRSKAPTREYSFYVTCFPTIHEFAAAAAAASKDSNQCTHLARESLEGFGGPNGLAGHLWANYTYYQTLLGGAAQQKPLFVVRTDHLWNDLEGIDTLSLLKGDGKVFVRQRQVQEQQKSEKKVATTIIDNAMSYHKDALTPTEYASLCCALQEELAVYQQLLQAALNLSPPEQQSTFQQVLGPCGGDDKPMQSLQDLKESCSARQ